jgi:tetrahydromethanopterin:alpha-L-glutamate ligase
MYCILTPDSEEYNSRALGKALKKAGISFIMAGIKDLVTFHGRKPHVKYNTHILDGCEKIFVRVLPSKTVEQVFYHMNVLRRLENLGVECINSVSTIEKCNDKFYTTSLFDDAGLRVPLTVCCENYDDAYATFLEMKDVVVKPILGSLGVGIYRINTQETAYRVLRSLEFHNCIFYLQEFLEHKNEDFRLMVCRDEVISTVKRKGVSWITNVHQGATPEKFSPTEEMVEMALKASRLLGCKYCGIDILESRGELYIIEANECPDLNVHQMVEDFDVASKVIELLR